MAKIAEIKCNCTVCGARFRVRLDRNGNAKRDAGYCVFCRSILEETDYRKINE